MAVTKKSSTAPVKKVKVDNSPEAKKARKEAAKARKGKLAELRAKARKDYKSLTPKEKQHLMERNIFTQAIRHGASEAEAKQEVLKYRKRKALKEKGAHATAQRHAARGAQKELRAKLKGDLAKAKEVLKAAKEHNKAIPDRKKRAEANAKATAAYQKTAAKIAASRAKASEAHKAKLAAIHENLQKVKKVFKKPTVKKGERLVSADKAAAPAAEVKKRGRVKSKMGKNDGPQLPAGWGQKKRGRKSKAEADWEASGAKVAEMAAKQAKKKPGRKPKAAAAPAAAEPAAPKKRGRPAKPKTEAAPVAEAPKKRGRKPKTQLVPASGKQSDPSFVGPKQKRGRKPKAAAAPAAAEAPKKRGRPAKAKVEAPAAEAPKKRGRPAKAPAATVTGKAQEAKKTGGIRRR